MTTRTIAAALGLAALAMTSGTALAQTAAPAAPAAPAPAHHPMSHHPIPHGKPAPVRAQSKESTVDELNAQSLAAAQAGKDFTPAPPTSTPAAKKM
jgi:hypothetical protein